MGTTVRTRARRDTTAGLFVLATVIGALSVPGCTESGGEVSLDAGGADGAGSVVQGVSYDEVAPIIAERCAGCHTEGGSAPFVLDTYAGLAENAQESMVAIDSGLMPPWPPDDDCRPLAERRYILDEVVDLLWDWIGDGMLPGSEDAGRAGASSGQSADPTALPFEPTHRLGLPAPYTPVFGESDDYRCFILDMAIEEPLYLTDITVEPGNALVHHVLVYALEGDSATLAAQLDDEEPGPGYTCFGAPIPLAAETAGGAASLAERFRSLEGIPTQIGGWVPGQNPVVSDGTVSKRLNPGSVIVMQIHYSLVAGEAMEDSATRLALRATPEPTPFLVTTSPVVNRSLDIPAGEREVTETIDLPYHSDRPLDIRGVTGHMHLLGTEIRAEVERAEDVFECALHIPRWDFAWQQSYRFAEGSEVTLNSGDGMRLTCVYDNSPSNQPVVNGEIVEPRDVTWGEDSLDEMCLLYLETIEPFTPPRDPDTPACAEQGCTEACAGDLTLECGLTCADNDIGCVGCQLAAFLECGGIACAATLQEAGACLTSCLMSAVSLRGNVGLCLAAECPDALAALETCAAPLLSSDACADALAACELE